MLNQFFCASSARKPCSGSKLREITGSGIFAAEGENGASETGSAAANGNNKTGLRIYQVHQIRYAFEYH